MPRSHHMALSAPRRRPAGSVPASDPATARPDIATPPPSTQPVIVDPDEQPQVVTVRATHAPAAEVSIDGGPWLRLPVVDLPSDAGHHRFVVRAPGFRQFQADIVQLSRRSLVVDVTPEELPRAVGTLVIEVDAAGARVVVDNVSLYGPPYSMEATAGDHHLRVTAPGRAPTEAVVTVPDGGLKRVAVQLGPQGTSPWVWGALGVGLAVAVGAGAAIYGRKG